MVAHARLKNAFTGDEKYHNLMTCGSNEPRHDKTNKLSVLPTTISLSIRPVLSETLLCVQWVAKDPSFLHADSKDSDQTGRMPRLICVFAGRTAMLLIFSWDSSNILNQNIVRRCFWCCSISREILAHFVLRKLIFQTRMRIHPVGLDVWLFGRTLLLLPFFIRANGEGSGETVRMHRLPWAFAGRLCDKYHNLMNWIICLALWWHAAELRFCNFVLFEISPV